MSPSLIPDPFQKHPLGNWEKRQRQHCEEKIALALQRLRGGEIDVGIFRDDKSEDGAKRWLWWQLHPLGGRWKYLGRPNWSVKAYESFRAQFLGIPRNQRFSAGAPCDSSVPYRRAHGMTGIMHEHVVPQKVLLDWLLEERDDVKHILDHNIGAIITRSEDRLLTTKSTHPNRYEPWFRYRGTGIQFIANPEWTNEQRDALLRFGLFNA